ncbi:2-oxoacid:acceptor oxidoreductase subunit alpha [Solirubrobacter sp. CPCC 204708]|uniref:2-oxoacid:acceptor oxidoreductase subunit alpha n=1 Tax=Solirubrobacter deserti TaxID=2282478 RepID=A0ABT4RTY0_9ACTN|nr:2-oxoacid:acceptor oxidoreductase subunit alpha [Solirubrobacter deserti]MDA0141991.1 2-oxoacid:acceptor oxidoreductase subunit alpha [Solirubrobacter deserti]
METSHRSETRERVVVRMAGDSGDGMQLAGSRFTDATAVFGNDLATLPDFPAEIRAPAGTVAGVSAFQIHFASRDILTPGDTPDVLVAMNPAALKANLPLMQRGATILVNEDAFSVRAVQKAGYAENPLEDGTLAGFTVKRVPMSSLTTRAVEGIEGATSRDAQKAKNLFALGVLSWLYDRPVDVTERWIRGKFKGPVCEANLAAFRAGWSFGETSELIDVQVKVDRNVDVAPGTYRNVNGTEATALGLIAASVKSGLPLVFGAYPITPASDLLHALARRHDMGARTIQAEDEIAAASMALGAAFGGALGVTCTSGPGLDLKTETIGLAVALELPMVIIDVQRAGPSTGMPTKTEQSDLLQALYGRHGESPLPVVAAQSPGQCFEAVFEAAQLAIKYRTPVILLSDLFVANSSEPWRIPDAASLPPIDPRLRTTTTGPFLPYSRDDNLARPWAIPGTPGLQHRIGGLEKADRTGAISYDGPNHARMTQLRAEKVDGIPVPDLEIHGEPDADLLVLGWGSSYGTIRAGARRVREGGGRVATAHLRHLRPMPANTGALLRKFERVLVPEMNSGQLAHELRARYLVDVISYSKVQGQPLLPSEMEQQIWRHLS